MAKSQGYLHNHIKVDKYFKIKRLNELTNKLGIINRPAAMTTSQQQPDQARIIGIFEKYDTKKRRAWPSLYDRCPARSLADSKNTSINATCKTF
jgi:hypothetical protein